MGRHRDLILSSRSHRRGNALQRRLFFIIYDYDYADGVVSDDEDGDCDQSCYWLDTEAASVDDDYY